MQMARAAWAEGVGAVPKPGSGGRRPDPRAQGGDLAFFNQTTLSSVDLGMSYPPPLFLEARRTTDLGLWLART